MIKHYYTEEEIVKIRNNLHSVLEFHKQFKKITLTEEEIMSNFLKGNFKPGSLEDPLLDCFGTAVFKYKFNNAVPKRINTMNNLPHIMEAEVVNKPTIATPKNPVIEGEFSSFTYSAKPSSKKPGKAIVSGAWNRGEESYEFRFVTKIENAADNLLATKFAPIAKLLDFLAHFNLTIEETEESKKGVYSITFAPAEVETYGQFFEIEAVEKEVNILDIDSIKEIISAIDENISDYQAMLESIATATKGSCREVTIDKGKNSVEYIATASPEVVGSLIKLSGNITTEETWTSAEGVKTISEHVIDDEDLEAMTSVIYDLDISNEGSDEEEGDEEEPVDEAEAPETEG